MKKIICAIVILLLSLITTITGFSMADVNKENTSSPIPHEETVLCITTEKGEETVMTDSSPKENPPVYVGKFSVAAYCGCELCCGSGRTVQTYYGTLPTADHTIAADFSLFSPGEKLLINEQVYVVEDRISSKNSDTLLIYFDSHEKALEFGRQTLDVSRLPEDEPVSDGRFLGTFIVTGYCSCDICTSSNGITYTGTVPAPCHTIAADPDIIPLHSKIQVNDIIYTVEDTGSAINGQRLDIYFETHEEAVTYGIRSEKVYLISQPDS